MESCTFHRFKITTVVWVTAAEPSPVHHHYYHQQQQQLHQISSNRSIHASLHTVVNLSRYWSTCEFTLTNHRRLICDDVQPTLTDVVRTFPLDTRQCLQPGTVDLYVFCLLVSYVRCNSLSRRSVELCEVIIT